MSAAATTRFAALAFGPLRMRQVPVLALIVLIAYFIGPSVFFSVCSAVLLWALASSPAERVLAVLLPVIFRVALAAGAFHFEPPVQILDLAMRNVDPFALVAQQDLWWARYLIAYPSIAAMDAWGMRFTDAFALYSAALSPFTVMVLLATVRTWRRVDERVALAIGLEFTLLVGLLATHMNGRLIPAHLGMAIILFAQARIVQRRDVGAREGALLAIGMVLSHMTSGTGLVAYLVLMAGGVLIILVGVARARMIAVLWLLNVLFGPLLYRDLLKNVDFYGGGPQAVFTMLDHGPGLFLRNDPLLAGLLVLAAGLVVFALWRIRRPLLATPRVLWPVALAIPVTSVGGLYGYSTLTMGIPAAMIVATAAAIGWRPWRRDRRLG